jgi:hypothetical protein
LALLPGQRNQHLCRALHGHNLRQPRALHLPAMGEFNLVCTAVPQPVHSGNSTCSDYAATASKLALLCTRDWVYAGQEHCSLLSDRSVQVWAFVLVAFIGGYIGSLFTSFNTWVCLVRKRWSGWFSFRVLEVCV